MATTIDDLAALGRPEIIAQVDYEAIFASRVAKFAALAAAAGFEYDVGGLDTDPVAIALQEASYKEVELRVLGNEIALQRYLYFAQGVAVDHLGRYYDCERLLGEKDDRYKLRIILAVQARSTGGTFPRYRLLALSASLRVADAYPYVTATSPAINVAVWSTDNNGVADPILLDQVSATLNATDVRMLNDTIVVRPAVVTVVDVAADVWLLPDTPITALDTIAATIAPVWAATGGLGRDLSESWIVAKIMQPGVQRTVVTTPTSDRVVQPYEALRIGTVTLTYKGRAY